MTVGKASLEKKNYTAVQQAIAIVGVGKKGSRNLPDELVDRVVHDLENRLSPAICEGAFFAALLHKGVRGSEEKIFSAEGRGWPPWREKGEGSEKNAQLYAVSFLQKHLNLSRLFPKNGVEAALQLVSSDSCLTREQARSLGFFLFSSPPDASADVDEFLRGFIVSWLRVRYESAEEWQGLYDAARSTVDVFPDSFLSGALHHLLATPSNSTSISSAPVNSAPTDSTPSNTISTNAIPTDSTPTSGTTANSIVVLTEPFNGFTHTTFFSLLLGEELSKNGFLVFFLLGENPGPKFHANLYDVVSALKLPFLPKANKNRADWDKIFFEKYRTRFGFFIDQKNTSQAVASWISRRRKIIKRPFLATIEKYLLPFSDHWQEKIILLTSAFHPPYVEKMVSLGEHAGFYAALVAKMTLEGGLTPSLLRPLKLSISARGKGGVYQKRDLTFPSEKRGMEEKKELALSDHILFFEEYMASGCIKDADWKKKWERMKEIYLPVLEQLRSGQIAQEH